jgi:hypothetical protein
MKIKSGLIGSLVGALLLTGCASTVPTPIPTVTVTASPSVLIFNPAESGKALAARIAARVKTKTATDKITGVECRNFANLRVGTHTDCQMRVNGVTEGFRATFTEREGHYVLKAQKLTW